MSDSNPTQATLWGTDGSVLKCSRCGEVKLSAGFYYRRHGSRWCWHRVCRACTRTESRQWRKDNIDRHRLNQRRCRLKKQFGITPEVYEGMLAAQEGKCRICSRLPSENYRYDHERQFPFCVDHDHATGRIRGLLCHHCNTLLGLAKDDPDILRRAIEYLTAPVPENAPRRSSG